MKLRAWGDLATGDHVSGTDKLGNTGIGHKSDFLSYYDFGTKTIWAEPVVDKTAESTIAAFKRILGPDPSLKVFYSDNHPTLIAACRSIDALHRPSQPGDPQSNGVIEGLNHRILSGARTLLIQCGLPYCFFLPGGLPFFLS